MQGSQAACEEERDRAVSALGAAREEGVVAVARVRMLEEVLLQVQQAQVQGQFVRVFGAEEVDVGEDVMEGVGVGVLGV